MSESPDREFLLSIFLMEAWDTLATLEDGLARLGRAEATAATLEPLLVVSHRLKGAAALHGFSELSSVAGVLEQLLERAPSHTPAERDAAAAFLGDVAGLLKTVLDGIGATGQENADDIAAFRARHQTLFPPDPPAPATPAPPGASGAAAPTNGAVGLRAELDRFFAENADILAYFRPEAAEHLETMTQALLALEQGGAREAELGRLFRAVHTLKGAAYTVGCAAVGDLAHQIEDLLVAVREERTTLTPAAIEATLAGTDSLRLLLGLAEAAPGELDALVDGAVAQLARLVPPGPERPASLPPAAPPVPATVLPAHPPAAVAPVVASAPARKLPTSGGAGIRVSLDRLDSLMNLVGELVIARSRLDRRLQELDRVGELLLFSRARMAKAVKDFEARRAAGAWTPKPPRPRTAGSGEGEEVATHPPLTRLFAELEFDRYDDFDILARSVAELSADLAEVQTEVGGLIRTIWEDTAQIQRLTGSLRSEVTRARMVPVGRLFARFGRQVREAAKAAGKSVVLETSGESVEVDNSIIEQIADPVLHLVQNAIAHGIEPEDARRARGKPAHGTVYLSAAHHGGFVHIEVEDDGRGIDVEHLRVEAVRRKCLRSEEAALLSAREVLNLMFLPGFSTAAVVTTASGRGVGLDVVRTNVGRLNGEIDVETEPGIGTRFTLKLPLTVVISDALLVRAGSETLAIPLNTVKLILAVRADAIQTVGRAEMVRVDGELVDLFRLDRLLGLAASAPKGRIPVVVLRAGGTSMAVAVDELGGKEEIVIKSLGGFREGIGPFSGATISGEGRVILLLDPGRLLELAEGGGRGPAAGSGGSAGETEPAQPRPAADAARRVLLVDDSISVRKFVGHMLERAGFRVVTANDGAEALQQLGETSVHLVITDLEMPRVNGYELIEDLRRRPSTRNLPVVVLTTRAGEKHLSLARRLGVEHYVSKPVDEQAFVRLVATLTAAERAEPELAGAAR